MTAKVMLKKDVQGGLESGTDNNSKKIENEKLKSEKKPAHFQAVTMEEFIEQRKKEYIFL